MGNDELRKLQLVILEMMVEVDRLCRAHDIAYSLIGGSLLGAVRHGGFIPWDDDADIGMTRAEYERFRAVCSAELDHERFFFQDHTTDPHYRWGYGKLRRKNSEFLREGQAHMKMQTGIFLDIFVADNVPDGGVARRLHKAYCYGLRKILYAEVGMVGAKNWFLRRWYRMLYAIPVGFVFRRLDALAKKCNKRGVALVRAYTFPTPKGEYGHPSRYYKRLAPVVFEGHEFSAFAEYDEYLSYKYGDYMTLPPENKRFWHPASVIRLP